MPIELWVLYGTWIVGYAIVSALLLTEFKTLYEKPILTFAGFIEEAARLQREALANIQTASNLSALDQSQETYVSEHGLLPKLAEKISLLAGEDHPEAGVSLKKIIRSINRSLREKRESLIPLSDHQVIDRLLNSPHRDLVAKIPHLKHIEGNKPIAELQDGLYHKVIFEKMLVENPDQSEPENPN